MSYPNPDIYKEYEQPEAPRCENCRKLLDDPTHKAHMEEYKVRTGDGENDFEIEYDLVCEEPKRTVKIKPNPKCKACKGSGELHQSEEFWGAPCTRDYFCDCVEEQISDDYIEGIDGEIELVIEDATEDICEGCRNPESACCCDENALNHYIENDDPSWLEGLGYSTASIQLMEAEDEA